MVWEGLLLLLLSLLLFDGVTLVHFFLMNELSGVILIVVLWTCICCSRKFYQLHRIFAYNCVFLFSIRVQI